ncbi:MAG: tetraacyldisaccharide 4'-kinase [Thermodesulfobacteriota bacterium]
MNLQPATRNSQLVTLLLPFGYLYSQAMRLRSKLYDIGIFKTRSLHCRVISIGNLTLGGAGKTPLTTWLARYLQGKGKRVAIVSRGYKAKNKGPVSIVSDGRHILLGPDEAGDEPFMMAQNLPGVPLLIGKKRFPVGMKAVKDFSPDVVLLDDGYQHLGLARDLNLLLLRTVKPFGNGRVFPAGTLREPLSALKRADAFILTYAEQGTESVIEEQRLFLQRRFPDKPVFISHCKPVSFYLLNETFIRLGRTKDDENPPLPPFTKGGNTLSPSWGKNGNSPIPPLEKRSAPSISPLEKRSAPSISPLGKRRALSILPLGKRRALSIPPLEKGDTGGFSDEKASHNLSELKGKKALAFCGIAHPGSFRDMLIRLGIDLVDFMDYPDHYDYHRGDLEEIEERAAGKGAEYIITTEKDAVKIETHMSHGDTKDNENPPSPPFIKGGDTLSPPLGKDGNSSVSPLGKDGDPSISLLGKRGDQLIPPLEKRSAPSIPPFGKRRALSIPPLEKGDTGGFSDEKPIELKVPIGVLKTEFVFESDFEAFINRHVGIYYSGN